MRNPLMDNPLTGSLRIHNPVMGSMRRMKSRDTTSLNLPHPDTHRSPDMAQAMRRKDFQIPGSNTGNTEAGMDRQCNPRRLL
jgi:hypothetical protein